MAGRAEVMRTVEVVGGVEPTKAANAADVDGDGDGDAEAADALTETHAAGELENLTEVGVKLLG